MGLVTNKNLNIAAEVIFIIKIVSCQIYKVLGTLSKQNIIFLFYLTQIEILTIIFSSFKNHVSLVKQLKKN